MKFNNIFRVLSAGVLLAGLASCHNKEQIFPDYEGGISAYFAYQYPVRTIVLGDSETYDTSLDNQHKCIIYGAMGGAYKGKDISVAIEVDNSLTENLYFDADGTKPVKAMPESYYKLAGKQLDYAGEFMGGVEVQLTDAFFADPDAIKNTYVIPVVMTKVVKGDAKIKTGTPLIEGDNPIRTYGAAWSEAPMDYTLYCIKYKNPWDGSWLRRGVDVVTGLDAGTYVRHEQYIENDEVVRLSTESLDAVTVPMSTNITTVTTTTEVSIVEDGYALNMVNAEAQDANWKSQVWYTLAEPMKPGVTYTFKCMAKATEQYDWCSVFLQSTTTGDQNYNHGMSFTTEWKETVMTITPDKDIYDKLTFNFGDKAITLMIDNVTFTEEGSDVNLIQNGDFEDQKTTGWSSWSQLEKIGVGCRIHEEVIENVNVETKTCNLKIAVDASGNCTVSSATEGIAASGTGKYVKGGEKLAWGNKDRDAIYLDYSIDFGDKKFATRDTLVARSREVTRELYTPTFINE